MFKSYFDEESKIFDKLRVNNKITHEFVVLEDEKSVFMDWLKIFSWPEFMVDVAMGDITIKKLNNSSLGKVVLFRIKVSGEEENVDRWVSNLKHISNFLKGNYEITYIKKRSKANAD